MISAVQSKTRRDPLTWEDRKTIAQVLSWDMYKFISPSEIETIRMEHDVVMVYLTDDRLHPIHRDSFKQILQDQKQEREQHGRQEQAHPESGVSIVEVEMPLGSVYKVYAGATFHGCYCYSPAGKNWIVMRPQEPWKVDVRVSSPLEAIALLTDRSWVLQLIK